MLTPADEVHHINKHNFKVPFVCGCRDLGEALRRIAEGAAMIRTKGEAGTGALLVDWRCFLRCFRLCYVFCGVLQLRRVPRAPP